MDIIYTINNKNWDGSSVSIIDLDSNLFHETSCICLMLVAGCGVSIIRDNKLNYQKTDWIIRNVYFRIRFNLTRRVGCRS